MLLDPTASEDEFEDEEELRVLLVSTAGRVGELEADLKIQTLALENYQARIQRHVERKAQLNQRLRIRHTNSPKKFNNS